MKNLVLLSLFLGVAVVLFPSLYSTQDINDAYPSYFTNQDTYACSTRYDCCLKAQATLRNIVYSVTDYPSATKIGHAIYPKCPRGYNYNRFTDTCTKTVPFEPIMQQPGFQNMSECLAPNAPTDESGDYYERQKECLRGWWMVHEECIRRTFNNCLKQTGRCEPALFDDWTSAAEVTDQYD
uniref:Chitin-binding type-2 domain-containing protein n=1 Tax=Paramoeba aestuarina TaxID=180227 RepID=A0A7S4K7X6_9EUKA|mmetsp:Transcript_16210/g.25199  ORF Transcript_16210/g.25199 Transcript_16210/m.25199 type:complete len:181 (+) Transcript_16210:113-655(+)|eukprot:CAMPEP_0201542206 /NCGR_PEP_ID=MMETSP0161_2-20130828/71907_1 /ASSEMBLY_ACC=CAM_ASM_000251 /TAXON_ID=180227 /ORGANISM="Neoparamoeba aestuarina, Strain SoJaBio B1-5/56/2" /LENGTH=180 /DNA_ID=CAMNT_0047949833 /DNA_START=85 /DNA_END=627 /DNA_ORIENTATION=-